MSCSGSRGRIDLRLHLLSLTKDVALIPHADCELAELLELCELSVVEVGQELVADDAALGDADDGVPAEPSLARLVGHGEGDGFAGLGAVGDSAGGVGVGAGGVGVDFGRETIASDVAHETGIGAEEDLSPVDPERARDGRLSLQSVTRHRPISPAQSQHLQILQLLSIHTSTLHYHFNPRPHQYQ